MDGTRAKRSSSYVGRILAAALVVLLVAGGAFALGRQNDGGNGTPQNAAANQPVSTAQTAPTQPAPLSGNEAEPAEAVAKVLGPAVVQIETSQGLGSGFIYDKSGLILTAAHVTDGESTVKIRLADGTALDGTVVGADNASDVAVVRVKTDKDLPVAVLATGVDPTVGETAIAIGSPFGLQSTVTQGIVSAVGRATQTPGGSIPAIQTDAAINPGNSGGALADRQGRIIGINDSIATGSSDGSSSGGNVGVGFAIPIDIAKNVADQLVAGKTPRAGFLGVSLSASSGTDAGALVTDVTSGSPADKAGLQAGDLITSVDGTNIESPTDLTAAIMTKTPGTKVTITAKRNGETKTFDVTLAERQGN